MTLPAPGDGDPRQLTAELRESRAGRREPDADLVPVVGGGEPMPAEEPAPAARPKQF
jgi:hypothetical protein